MLLIQARWIILIMTRFQITHKRLVWFSDKTRIVTSPSFIIYSSVSVVDTRILKLGYSRSCDGRLSLAFFLSVLFQQYSFSQPSSPISSHSAEHICTGLIQGPRINREAVMFIWILLIEQSLLRAKEIELCLCPGQRRFIIARESYHSYQGVADVDWNCMPQQIEHWRSKSYFDGGWPLSASDQKPNLSAGNLLGYLNPFFTLAYITVSRNYNTVALHPLFGNPLRDGW